MEGLEVLPAIMVSHHGQAVNKMLTVHILFTVHMLVTIHMLLTVHTQ